MTSESRGSEPPPEASSAPSLRERVVPFLREKVAPFLREKVVPFIALLPALVGAPLAADQLCMSTPLMGPPSNPWWAYIGLGLALLGIVLFRIARHRQREHKARRDDRSEVEALFVEARTAERRIANGTEGAERPEDFARKIEKLKAEIGRLEKVGWQGWTEYRVLPLRQLLVKFLKEEELKATARSVLDELDEYAKNSYFPYDRDLFNRWENRVREAEESIDAKKGAGTKDRDRDDAAEALRAVLQALYEHVADYKAKWAKGSALVEDLWGIGVLAIPVILVASLIPWLHPAESTPRLLGVLNWGLLGVVGAGTAALLSIRQSDLVEVGNTEGKRELSRATLGTALGLVAGVLAFGIVAGGLIGGPAVPDVQDPRVSQIGLSLLWGIGAGFSFERIFERVQGLAEAMSS